MDRVEMTQRRCCAKGNTAREPAMHPRRIPHDFVNHCLPEPSAAPASLTTFVICPVVLLQNSNPCQQLWQCALYQWAFEQARAAARPSLLERDLLAVWN